MRLISFIIGFALIGGCCKHAKKSVPANPSNVHTNMPVGWFIATDGHKFVAVWPSGKLWPSNANGAVYGDSRYAN